MAPTDSLWINEIMYDNSGIDSAEFIEVIAPESLTDIRLFLYNGINGVPYDSILMDSISWEMAAPGLKIYRLYYAGIQNGAPDGMALFSGDMLAEALSYEGSFTGTEGPAAGIYFEDIGVFMDGTRSNGYSLQRYGPGSRRKHFYWKQDSLSSPGSLNHDQWLTLQPAIVIEPQSPLDFGTIPYTTSSDAKNYRVHAVNLNSDLSITAPVGYEISLSPGFEDFRTGMLPMILMKSEDMVFRTEIYVRFTPVAADNRYYEEVLTHMATSAEVQYIPLTGIEGVPSIPNAWMNEFHYDNEGPDTNEFIEIVIQYPDRYVLDNLSITLYNGINGTPYDVLPFTSTWEGEKVDNVYQIYVFPAPGLQNGSPDGFALSYDQTVLQLISYEGTFVATSGIAEGLTSRAVFPEEDGLTPHGSSIQLAGEGNSFDDFSWFLFPGNESPGRPNFNQILPIIILQSRAESTGNGELLLSWQMTPAETDFSYEVSGSMDKTTFESLGTGIVVAGDRMAEFKKQVNGNFKLIRVRILDTGQILFTIPVVHAQQGDFSIVLFENEIKLNQPGIYKPLHEIRMYDLHGNRIPLLGTDSKMDTFRHPPVSPGIYLLQIVYRQQIKKIAIRID